jgi:lipopolysaccharide export system permease protein
LPIFLTSLFITLVYIGFETTSFVDAGQKASNIKDNGVISSKTKNLFLKSNDNYIYIDELNPIKQEAKDIKVFKLKNQEVSKVLTAKIGRFRDNSWELSDVKEISIIKGNSKSMQLKTVKKLQTLEGFKPKIIDNVFQGKSKLTVQDSINAISFLDRQGLNSDKVRANLYYMLFFPLSIPFIVFAIFFPMPLQRRGVNLTLLNSAYILGILLIWGILFTLAKITLNGALSPMQGIVLPIVAIILIAFYMVYRNGK